METLILGGCGKRDYVILGALHYMFIHDYLSNVKKVITGCSTINVAVLLAVGYTPIDIALLPEDYRLRDVIVAKLGIVPTLGGLKAFSNLELVLAMNDRYMSSETNPDVGVLEAVESCSRTVNSSFLNNPYPVPLGDHIVGDGSLFGIVVIDETTGNGFFDELSRLTTIPRNELIKRTIRESNAIYAGKIEHVVLYFPFNENRVTLFVKGRSDMEEVWLSRRKKSDKSSDRDESNGEHAPEVSHDFSMIHIDDEPSDDAGNGGRSGE